MGSYSYSISNALEGIKKMKPIEKLKKIMSKNRMEKEITEILISWRVSVGMTATSTTLPKELTELFEAEIKKAKLELIERIRMEELQREGKGKDVWNLSDGYNQAVLELNAKLDQLK